MQLHIELLPYSEALEESKAYFFIYKQFLKTSALNITSIIDKELHFHPMIIHPGIIIHLFIYYSTHYYENFQQGLMKK